MITRWGVGQPRWVIFGIAGLATLGLLLLAVAAFPFGLFKGAIERNIEKELGTDVSIGAVERREAFSFTPTILIHNLAIRQPSWAGQGNMLQARTIEARIPILKLLTGGGAKPESLTARGLIANLVRDVNGHANWEGREAGSGGGSGRGLSQLVIPDGRFSLRDDKKFLILSGTLISDARGLLVDGTGRFHEAPARLSLAGQRIAGLADDAPYSAELKLTSSLLRLEAKTQMRGALNLQSMTMDVHATAHSLKYLDHVIEAGLFGTRPIDLTAKVRHDGRDWFIERMTGRIGRSALVAKANVLKRDGRTKIDADVHFSRFDFDDLSDARGEARAKAVEARIGERVLPGTRINIAKVGPTDGVIRFRADRLLLQDSAFRSLAGEVRLDFKLLTIDKIVAGMTSGRMTGNLRIDQRNNVPKPRLSMDLVFADGRLETLMGTDDATGPMRGRVVLSGTGDTIREAMATADGRAGLMVRNGTIKRTFAAVLGQDLGKAIGAALKKGEPEVPLRCLAIAFAAKRGFLRPSPFIVDTGISTGRGEGHLSLASEAIALTIKGQSRDPSPLRLADPIQVGGTFTKPTLSAAGTPPGSKVNAGSVVQAVGKSLGRALGLGKDEAPRPALSASDPCEGLAGKIL
ncbi:AsmA family protein [Sphingobium sp. CR28]|uniref:AsmA family protein n=1 Tax=Sphingobium sp. CR28 TaxID=3400272 RepID=UPI003FEFBA41